MKTPIFLRLRLPLPLLLGLALLLPCNVWAGGPPRDSELPGAWNARLLTVAEAEDRFLTLKGVRAAAMMHLAMHDAINATDPRYRSYALDADGRDADPIAAATQAAFVVANDQYPAQRDQWESLRRHWMSSARNTKSRDAGIALGDAAAQAVLAKRAGDRWNNTADYKFHPMAPGVYAEFSEHSGTPQGFVFGAGWAAVEPFALESPSQFRAPPPPAINSAEYTRAFDEVRTVGRFNSRARTADQTHLAFWWKEFAEASHNRLARQLVSEEQPDLWTAARFFALLNVSIMDAYIGNFDSKFFYNHWRPYTAIRWAARDGNPHTRAEPDWNNTHRHTYAFPSYPSAHGAACAAAMTVFADTFGDERWFRMTTPQVDAAGPLSEKIAMKPPTRSFKSFSAAARECAGSRVYLGIHFRYDSIEGNRQGTRIGRHVVRTLLPRLPGNVKTWERAIFDDVALEYRLSSAGEPVVFIHGGLFADGLEPLANAAPLADVFHVLRWRRVGYVRSGPAAGHSAITSQAAQLARLMRRLKLPRAHVVGHSSGGLIALQLAIDQPGLVRSLVLLEPALSIPGVDSSGIAPAIDAWRKGDRQGAVDLFMRAVAGAEWRDVVEQEIPEGLGQALADAHNFFEQELPAVRAWQFGENEARRIDVSVLAVMGGESADVSPNWPTRQAFLVSTLPHVEAYVHPGARHMLGLEDPHALARQIAEFLERH